MPLCFGKPTIQDKILFGIDGSLLPIYLAQILEESRNFTLKPAVMEKRPAGNTARLPEVDE